MVRDGINGIGDWWADALADDPSPVVRSKATHGKRVKPEPPPVDPDVRRTEIAQWRAEQKQLPPGGRTRREVGRQLHEYDSNLCAICKTPIDITLQSPHPGGLQLDHIWPRAIEGDDTWDNVQITHRTCNLMKSDFVGDYPSPEQALAQLNLAILHWDNPDVLLRDFKIISERYMGQKSAIRAMNAELEGRPDDDPHVIARREELHPVAVEMIFDERLYYLYFQRVISYRRRTRKAAGAMRHETPEVNPESQVTD
jgi:5-methylcytosine-specific restriction endonuclease McrA